MNTKIIAGIVLLPVMVMGGYVLFQNNAQVESVASGAVHDKSGSLEPIMTLAGNKATMYKHTNCGCCDGHKAALEEAGMEVTVVELPSVNAKKQEYGVLPEQASCHTLVVNDGEYVVEGHVPVEGVAKLLSEKPNISGIALPGMPIGTPGMPGPKTQDYVVEVIGTGETFATY